MLADQRDLAAFEHFHRARRIARYERLDAVPDHQRDVRVIRVFAVPNERLGDRPALLGPEPLQCGREVKQVIGDAPLLRGLKPEQFTDEKFGVPTVRDILKELEKPGRDPRPEFKAARFADGVEDIKDLQVGMILEGVVSNVAAFGAFVDIGVHQDGLIHISALSDKYVKDPREVVKAGDVVKVRVIEVDIPRKRIALTRRLDDSVPAPRPSREERDAPRGGGRADNRGQREPARGSFGAGKTAPAPANNALADAFARAKRGS